MAKAIKKVKDDDAAAKKKVTWTSGKCLGVGDRCKISYERDSPPNLKKRFNREKDKTPDKGPFGGDNPFKTKKKSLGSDFENAPDLKIGTKYKDNKPSPTTTKSKSKDTGGTSDSDKAAWLKRTRNSPAAKSGAFTDAERWALQKKKRLKIKKKDK